MGCTFESAGPKAPSPLPQTRRVVVPYTPTPHLPVLATRSTMSLQSSPRSLRVLVVDDEPRIRNALTMCLEGEGYEVEPVARADEAHEAVRSRPYDLVFQARGQGISNARFIVDDEGAQGMRT